MIAALDMNLIAAAIGTERRGRVPAHGGYFGALELAAKVASRFRVPEGGGRATEQVAALLLEGAVQNALNREQAG